MNRKQKVAVAVGALLIALLAIFPPWIEGYPPYYVWRFRYDAARMVDHEAMRELQIAVLVLTVAAVLVLKGRKAAS